MQNVQIKSTDSTVALNTERHRKAPKGTERHRKAPGCPHLTTAPQKYKAYLTFFRTLLVQALNAALFGVKIMSLATIGTEI